MKSKEKNKKTKKIVWFVILISILLLGFFVTIILDEIGYFCITSMIVFMIVCGTNIKDIPVIK